MKIVVHNRIRRKIGGYYISLNSIVPEYKRLRVIVDTDAACEVDDPFAIAHALMIKKFEVKAIFAEQFGNPGTTKISYDEIMTVLDPMSLSGPVYMGESWSLGDSPAVGVALDPYCGTYVYREAPIFNEDTSYGSEEGRPKIRVYTSINSRFILEDFISKLELLYGN